MNHDHKNPNHLVAGCRACIMRRQADQEQAEYVSMLPMLSTDELVELLMGREHIHDDWKAAALTNEIARREAGAA